MHKGAYYKEKLSANSLLKCYEIACRYVAHAHENRYPSENGGSRRKIERSPL